MKTILVTTDFSKASKNALLYAAEMALYSKAKLILLNVFDSSLVPTAIIDAGGAFPNPEVIESNTKLELEKEKKRIESKFGADLVGDIEFKYGFVVQEINRYAEENSVDLIIMGVHSADFFTERFLGSTPTMTIRNAKRPVLLVGEQMVYHQWKKMVLAVDANQTDYEPVLANLKKWVKLFNTRLYVLHLSPAFVTEPTEDRDHLLELDDELEDTEHSLHFRTGDNLIEEINEFARETEADLIAMIPRKHSLLSGIFSEAKTKQMAFHSKVPLLSLHE